MYQVINGLVSLGRVLKVNEERVGQVFLVSEPLHVIDDGIAEAGSALLSLVDIVYKYSKHWRFEAKVKKCAIMFFLIRRSFR